VLGDHWGNLIHLGERECSIQRRHQKVVEECPSPVMLQHPELRARMGEAALRIARAAGYANAGTMEFLVDRDLNFYFLEMNTRLQVEHPVTELVTGVDLVAWQLRIAAGERLTLTQRDIAWRGSAIECRIYAEDPASQFLPSPGRITHLREPSGPGIRLDSGVYGGWDVPVDYDPLLAKLAAWAPSREEAIRRLDRALVEYEIGGIRTNVAFFRQILADADFRAGRLSTEFLARRTFAREAAGAEEEAAAAIALATAASAAKHVAPAGQAKSAWLAAGIESLLR
jgi:acetyl-CoA carboxylase biotin carboxylase subunit